MAAQDVDITRQARGETGDLRLQHGNEQQERRHQGDKENRGDDQDGDGPRTSPPFQSVGNRIQEIGDQHAGDERHQHAAQFVQQEHEDGEARQADPDVPCPHHARFPDLAPLELVTVRAQVTR